MSKHVKHVPTHRAAPTRSTMLEAPRSALRTTVVLSSVAAAATGVTISGGLLASPGAVSSAATDADQDTLGASLAAAAGPASAPEAEPQAAEVGERDAGGLALGRPPRGHRPRQGGRAGR